VTLVNLRLVEVFEIKKKFDGQILAQEDTERRKQMYSEIHEKVHGTRMVRNFAHT